MSVHELDRLLNTELLPPLNEWLYKNLLKCHGQSWWELGVLEKLTDRQKDKLRNSSEANLEKLDLQSVLHVAAKNIPKFAEASKANWDIRTPLEAVRDARNALSHRPGGRAPEGEDVLYFVLSAKRLMTLIGAKSDAIQAADQLIRQLTTPAPADDNVGSVNTPPRNEGGKENAPAKLDVRSQAPVAGIKQAKASAIEMPPVEKQAAGEHGDSLGDISVTGRVSGAPDSEPEDVNDSQPPLVRGVNECVASCLVAAERSGEGGWQLSLEICAGGETRQHRLEVPHYLGKSAKAAADILQAVKARDPVPPIKVNLINVLYDGQTLSLPASLDLTSDQYPLIVVQPSYLVNVTDLAHFDFCPRKYLMDRYTLTISNDAMLRGTFVHEAFGALLKHPGDSSKVLESCRDSLRDQVPRLVMQGISPKTHYDNARNHLKALAGGVKGVIDFSSVEEVFIERFMINPKIGLKGKIDALLKKSDGRWQALELKTGKSWGANANVGHAFQVSAYYLLLNQAGIKNLESPCVVYTGNNAKILADGGDPLPASTMFKRISFNASTAIDTVNLRNELVRIDYVGTLEFNSNENKCAKCKEAGICVSLHKLGMDGGLNPSHHLSDLLANGSDAHKELFCRYNNALLAEFQAVRIEHGDALQGSEAYRVKNGTCLSVKSDVYDTQRHLLTLNFPLGNASEFREGDPCILSDENGPVYGNCIEVYIHSIDKAKATVSLPSGISEMWFEPALLDENSPDSAYKRNFAALYAMVSGSGPQDGRMAAIRDLLEGKPVSIPENTLADIPEKILAVPGASPLTNDQKRAISLALGLQKLLLIQGPPGTGKTVTLAKMVAALVNAGKRVLIATYTHRAADEVMNKLAQYAPEVEARKLGQVESVALAHKGKCLDLLLESDELDGAVSPASGDELSAQAEAAAQRVQGILNQPAVYIGTTHAWLSGEYDNLLLDAATGQPQSYDVAVIEEASQIILPNLLGVLRLADRWILVGDHRQLPPVVIGENTEILGLTLFELLARHLGENDKLMTMLKVQHRMPPVVSKYIGATFYGDRLTDSPKCAAHKMQVLGEGPLFDGHKHIVLVNVTRNADKVGVRQYREEATWIASYLKKLYGVGGLPLRLENGRPTVGVIAPYRAQVALIRRELESELAGYGTAEDWRGIVDTVDRFQGDERNLIIVSLCLSPDPNAPPPRIYAEERRINVALSRAQNKLCIVGAIESLISVPGLAGLRTHVRQYPGEASEVTGDVLK